MLKIFESFTLNDVVRSLAFTPNGTVLAATGGNTTDFAIHLLDVVNGQPLGDLEGHTGIIWSLGFSPNGQMLASVSSDQTAKIWDWRSGTLLQSLDFPGQVVSVSFSPDGQTLAIGGVDEPQNRIQNASIWTFSVDSWKPLLKFPEYLDITAMAYSPDGKWLVGGGASRNVQVWNTSGGPARRTLNHAHQVMKAVISPDSSSVATATCTTTVNDQCTEGGVWVWDLRTGRLVKKLAGFPDVVENVAFSADGSSLVASSRDGTLRFYGTPDYHPLFDFPSPGGISALALSPSDGLLATGGVNGEVRVWKIIYQP
jgi:WD40 repeat protein